MQELFLVQAWANNLTGIKTYKFIPTTIKDKNKQNMSLPRHRGLGEECTTFFQKDARSSLAANSEVEANDHRRARKRRRICKQRSKGATPK